MKKWAERAVRSRKKEQKKWLRPQTTTEKFASAHRRTQSGGKNRKMKNKFLTFFSGTMDQFHTPKIPTAEQPIESFISSGQSLVARIIKVDLSAKTMCLSAALLLFLVQFLVHWHLLFDQKKM